MNRSELIKLMAAKADLPQTTCKQVLQQVEKAICVALHHGEAVYLPTFGVFEIRYHLPRTGRNPKTGAPIEIPFTTTAAFKPSAALKRTIQEQYCKNTNN